MAARSYRAASCCASLPVSGIANPSKDSFGSRNGPDATFDIQDGGDTLHGDIGSSNDWCTTAADATGVPWADSDVWGMVTYVVTTGTYTIYFNGSEVGSGSWEGGCVPVLFDADHDIFIASSGLDGAIDSYNGTVDEVLIFDRALAASDVQRYYDAAMGLLCSTPTPTPEPPTPTPLPPTPTDTPTPTPTDTPTPRQPPPDPASIAPAVDRTVATNVFATTQFLYTGSNPVQVLDDPNAIDPRRAGVCAAECLRPTARRWSELRSRF